MTRIIFLGTKGEIEESRPRHRFHSSLLILSEETRLLIDYGILRKHTLDELKPDAILITHAHPDHYAWLKEDINTDTTVYLTEETIDYGKFKPGRPVVIKAGNIHRLGPINFEAYRVLHSIRCPAVGYKIYVAGIILVYNPDLVDIINKEDVLKGVSYYVGDGSSIRTNLVRRKGDQIFGHARITTQINWCHNFGIENIIFTHLGKETLDNEEDFQDKNNDIILAYDGMEMSL